MHQKTELVLSVLCKPTTKRATKKTMVVNVELTGVASIEWSKSLGILTFQDIINFLKHASHLSIQGKPKKIGTRIIDDLIKDVCHKKENKSINYLILHNENILATL